MSAGLTGVPSICTIRTLVPSAAGRPRRHPERGIGAFGPRVLDQPAEHRDQGGHPERTAGRQQRALEHAAALDARLVAGVQHLRGQGLPIDLVGHADVPLLDGDLVRHDLLRQRDDAEAEQQDGRAQGQPDQRRVQRVHPLPIRVGRLVLGRPEDEHEDEDQAEQRGQQEPHRHVPLGALVRRGARDVALAVFDQLDAVQRHAEVGQLLLGHLAAFVRVGNLQVRVAAHALDPIHNVAATIAPIPTRKAIRPSGAGPKPPAA